MEAELTSGGCGDSGSGEDDDALRIAFLDEGCDGLQGAVLERRGRGPFLAHVLLAHGEFRGRIRAAR